MDPPSRPGLRRAVEGLSVYRQGHCPHLTLTGSRAIILSFSPGLVFPYTPDRSRFNSLTLVFLLLLAGLAGCASAPPEYTAPPAVHQPVLDVAVSELGTPYRYGGSTPRGFDCSGLVYYAYYRTGIRVPRSTMAQYRHARPVALKNLQPGDLVFFRTAHRSISHVGIYAGNARFIHAPSRGRVVSYDSLNDPYWKQRLVAAGRYH